MEFIILFIISVLPVILLGKYIYDHDFDKEPLRLIVTLFLMGICSTLLTLVLTLILISIFPFFGDLAMEDADLLMLIPYVFIGVALIEETSKWVFAHGYGYHHKEFNHAYDGIVYATAVALGFACFENILYVYENGFETGIFRAITAVPGHVCFGILMGFYLACAKIAEKQGNIPMMKKNKLRSWLYPILAHGLYDYFAFGAQIVPALAILFFSFVYYMFSTIPKKLHQLEYVYYNIGEGAWNPNPVSVIPQTYYYQYCPKCGERVVGNFCMKCGHKHNN